MFLEIKLTHFEHSVGKKKKAFKKPAKSWDFDILFKSRCVFLSSSKIDHLPANVLFFLHQIDNQALAAAFIFVCHPMGENLLLARREQQLSMHFFSNISDKKGWEKNNNLVPENRYYVCTSLSTPLMRAWWALQNHFVLARATFAAMKNKKI